jgi:ABC-type sugar transport system ATPase subunit
MAEVELHDVTVRRGGVTLLDHVDLSIADGELVGVVGPSGAGKTTLLRVIAGLERPDAGSVVLDGEDVTQLAPGVRDVSMVFQHPVLIPRRSVRRNVGFPLEVRNRPREEIRARVDAETRALHIEDLAQRSARELSAGEAQLVQIARAMVRVPRVLLLDEPLARLDAAVRQRLRRELRELQQGYGTTTVLTTNDPIEAMTMPDRLVVLERGTVVQHGIPRDVYDRPVDLSTAASTGDVSTFDVAVVAAARGFWLEHERFRLRAWRPSLSGLVGGRVVLGVRPSAVVADVAGQVPATVVVAPPLTGTATCRVGDDVVLASVPGHPSPGTDVRLRIDDYAVFDTITGQRLD